MKILHVIDSMDLFRGGPTVCVASIAAAQASDGNDVSVVCYGLEDPETFKAFLLSNIPNFEKIDFYYVERLNGLNYFYPKKLFNSLKNCISETSIVHVHGVWCMILYLSCLIAKRSGKKYIITPHGMLDPWSLSQKKIKKQIALVLGWKRLLNNAHFLHALNADESKLLKPLNLTAAINVVPNGIFDSKFINFPNNELFLSKYPVLKGKKFVLFLSRLHFKKGLDYLIDAYDVMIKKMPNVDLVVAGPDDGWMSELYKQVASKSLENKVHIIGPLYNELKYSAYSAASCFCLPSRQEGFSIAIIEAMACGLPVVISKSCNFNEVSVASAGYVVDLNESEISIALIKLLSNDSEAIAMGNNGRELIFKNYTWKKIARRLIELY